MASLPQEGDDKPCLPPSIGYPPSGYPMPYNDYGEQYHVPGYPTDPTHRHFLHTHSIPGQVPPSGPPYYMASQIAYPHPESKTRCTFAHIMLCLLVVLIICTTLMSLLLWAIFGSQGPKFELETFSVPLFNISDTSLEASWEADVTVTNPNKKLTLSFGHIESRLVYKEFLLDTTVVEPVNVDQNAHGLMVAKFAVPSPDYDSNKVFCLRALNEDYVNGSILFNVRFVMEAMMSSENVWRRQTTLTVLCEDLEVKFEKGGAAKWDPSKHDCYLTV